MSLRNIYKHLDKMSKIVRVKFTEPGKSKDKHISQKPHVKYNLDRYNQYSKEQQIK